MKGFCKFHIEMSMSLFGHIPTAHKQGQHVAHYPTTHLLACWACVRRKEEQLQQSQDRLGLSLLPRIVGASLAALTTVDGWQLDQSVCT